MTDETDRSAASDVVSSGLFYSGTTDEVRLGDRVRIHRLLRRDLMGTVCYIPGISPPHPDLEYDDVRQWAIRLDDGTVLAIGYSPEHRLGQPKRDLILVNRSGDSRSLMPDEELD